MRTIASFTGDFPKDGRPAEPPGRAIIEWLREALASVDDFEIKRSLAEDYAQGLELRVGPRRFAVMVGLVEDEGREWMLAVDSLLAPVERLLRKTDRAELQRLVSAVHAVLDGDRRVSELRWYTPKDWNLRPGSHGYRHPVEEA